MTEINEALANIRELIQHGRSQEAIDAIVLFPESDMFWLMENIAYDMVGLISSLSKEVVLDSRELQQNRALSERASELARYLSLSNQAVFSTVLKTATQFENKIVRYSQSTKLGTKQGIVASTNTINVILGVLQYLREHANFSIVFPEIEELNTSTLQNVIVPFVSAIEEIASLSRNTEESRTGKVEILKISRHSPVELVLQNFGVLGPIVLIILYLSPHGQALVRLKLDKIRADNLLTQAKARRVIAEAEKIEAETRNIEAYNKGRELAQTYASLTGQPEEVSDRLTQAFDSLTEYDFTIETMEPEKPPKPTTLPEQ